MRQGVRNRLELMIRYDFLDDVEQCSGSKKISLQASFWRRPYSPYSIIDKRYNPRYEGDTWRV